MKKRACPASRARWIERAPDPRQRGVQRRRSALPGRALTLRRRDVRHRVSHRTRSTSRTTGSIAPRSPSRATSAASRPARCPSPPFASGGERFARPGVSGDAGHLERRDRRTARGPAGGCRPRRSGSGRRAGRRGGASPGAMCGIPSSRTTAPSRSTISTRRDGFLELAPVGSFPDGRTPDGIEDLAGNVDEWVADWFSPEYPKESSVNPTGPDVGDLRVVRGGAYGGYRRGTARALVWLRSAARCARSAEPAPHLAGLPLRPYPLRAQAGRRALEALGSANVRIAHLSDLHLLSLEGAVPFRLFNKRITGYANLRFNRRSKHKPFAVRAAAKAIRALGVDHVVITGRSLEPGARARVRARAELPRRRSRPAPGPGEPGAGQPRRLHARRVPLEALPRLLRAVPALGSPGARRRGKRGAFPFVHLRGPVAIIGLSTAVPRLPLVASGRDWAGAARRARPRPRPTRRSASRTRRHPPAPPAPQPREPPRRRSRAWPTPPRRCASSQRLTRGLVLHGHLHRRCAGVGLGGHAAGGG